MNEALGIMVVRKLTAYVIIGESGLFEVAIVQLSGVKHRKIWAPH